MKAIFNSLGSNYDFSFALKSLFQKGIKSDASELKILLEQRYNAKAVLTYKGRDAILLALKTLNLPDGSAVAINGFTCFAVFEAIKNADLNVEYLDIEKDNLNFSVKTLKEKIKSNPKIKVVMIQNTLGYPCDIRGIAQVCKENKLILIEDLAHSIGLVYDTGEEAGTVGDFAALSFSQDKVIDAITGGALIIKTEKFQNTPSIKTQSEGKERFYPLLTFLVRVFYQVGIGKILHLLLKTFRILINPMEVKGSNFVKGLPLINASLAKTQFQNLQENIAHRKLIAGIYATNLNSKVLIYSLKQTQNSLNLRFPIRVINRSGIVNFLKNNNIYISDIWYDSPIAPKKYLSKTDYKNQCPNAEFISEEILNLPTHINVSEQEAQEICKNINKWQD